MLRQPPEISASIDVWEEAMQIAITIVQVIAAVLLILMVLLQSGKSEGLSGAIAGGSKSFMRKNKSHSWDAKVARATKWVATVFIVLTFVLSLV